MEAHPVLKRRLAIPRGEDNDGDTLSTTTPPTSSSSQLLNNNNTTIGAPGSFGWTQPYRIKHRRARSSNGNTVNPYTTLATRRGRCLWLGITLVALGMLRLLWTSDAAVAQRHHARVLPWYNPTMYNYRAATGDRHQQQQQQQDETITYTVNDWPYPMIHVVHTRFMQEQGNLTSLGAARLALFRIFCLPTMVQQTAPATSFLWIVKTDPNLDPSLLATLVELLEPYPNFYLVTTNINFRINSQSMPGAWRGGAEGRLLSGSITTTSSGSMAGRRDEASQQTPQSQQSQQPRIYTGNRTALEIALAMADQLLVLETRLDADDGVHLQYIERLQQFAAQDFTLTDATDTNASAEAQVQALLQRQKQQAPVLRWKYWCSRRHMAWHWVPPPLHKNENQTHPQQQHGNSNKGRRKQSDSHNHRIYGRMDGSQHQHMCIASGLTAAFAVGTPAADVPVVPHHKLAVTLQSEGSPLDCGRRNSNECLSFVDWHAFEVVRSRTPTSAGMLDILNEAQHAEEEEDDDDEGDLGIERHWLNYAYWDVLHESFGIQREQVRWVQAHVTKHLVDIAKDNLLGQCTTGHSCKQEAKADLQKIIAMYPRHGLIDEVTLDA